MDAAEREELARRNFTTGYNCAQSVVRAFDDVFEEHGVDPETAALLASPLGGGMGRMREVCGAVSGMLLVLGLAEGYNDPEAFDAKKELYEKAQALAGAFKDENGSIICRELLGLDAGPSEATPEKRTESYYGSRPCAELVAQRGDAGEAHGVVLRQPPLRRARRVRSADPGAASRGVSQDDPRIPYLTGCAARCTYARCGPPSSHSSYVPPAGRSSASSISAISSSSIPYT